MNLMWKALNKVHEGSRIERIDSIVEGKGEQNKNKLGLQGKRKRANVGYVFGS